MKEMAKKENERLKRSLKGKDEIDKTDSVRWKKEALYSKIKYLMRKHGALTRGDLSTMIPQDPCRINKALRVMLVKNSVMVAEVIDVVPLYQLTGQRGGIAYKHVGR
jgi:hypothetical protein